MSSYLGLKGIFRNKSLNGRLRLINLGLSEQGAKTIDLILRKNKSIKKLYLNNNKLEDDGAVVIGKALPATTSLIHLSICSNGITSRGCKSLFDGIK